MDEGDNDNPIAKLRGVFASEFEKIGRKPHKQSSEIHDLSARSKTPNELEDYSPQEKHCAKNIVSSTTQVAHHVIQPDHAPSLLDGLVEEKYIDLELRFLQLAQSTIKSFNNSSVYSSRDLILWLNSPDKKTTTLLRKTDHLHDYLNDDNTFDLERFYRESPKFNRFCLKLHSFDIAVTEIGNLILPEDLFGKSIIWLNANGIHTYHTLWEKLALGMDKAKGLGITRFNQIVKGVIESVDNKNSLLKPDLVKKFEKISSAQVKGYKNQYLGSAILSNKLKNTRLEELHMGKKLASMHAIEIFTLGDFLNKLTTGLPKLRGFGKNGLNHMLQSSFLIVANLNKDQDVNWEKFCSDANIPYIPEDTQTKNGEQFLSLIPYIVDQLIKASADQVEKIILSERLIKPTDEQKTLEDLGNLAGVTRERIRQKEAAILTDISNALLYDEYSQLEYRFRPKFCSYFHKAANILMDMEEMTINQLTEKLAMAWNVPTYKILPHMPFITAVLTSKSVTPKKLRLDKSIPLGLFGEIPDSVGSIKIKHLRLCKYADILIENGVEDVKSLLELSIKNHLPFKVPSKGHKIVIEQLQRIEKLVFSGIQQETSIREQLATINNELLIPEVDIENLEQFLSSVKLNIKVILAEKVHYKNTIEIFELRTSRIKRNRNTLDATGKKLNSHGPSIKKTESRMLQKLHQQLVNHDFRDIQCCIRDSFLKYWLQIHDAYKTHPSFKAFKQQLAKKWDIPTSKLDNTIDLFWSVVALSPHGYNIMNPRTSWERKPKPESRNLGVIKLRGFKRVF